MKTFSVRVASAALLSITMGGLLLSGCSTPPAAVPGLETPAAASPNLSPSPLGGGVQGEGSGSAFIWWEAEKPRATNFPPPAQNPFHPANEKEVGVLSGGDWIGASNDRTAAALSGIRCHRSRRRQLPVLRPQVLEARAVPLAFR